MTTLPTIRAAHRVTSTLALCLGALTLGSALMGSAQATEAGMRGYAVPMPEGPAATALLFYPTEQAAQAIPAGPFQPIVAPGAPLPERVKGLIVLSHGTGGTEMGHHDLARALAQAGYLVAALKHPKDNWQDRSLAQRPDYFVERPRQLSRLLDTVLADPDWKDRIPAGRIGALGHSAGGYSVLALAGGRPDLSALRQHCQAHAAADPGFCHLGKHALQNPAPTPAPTAASAAPDLRDTRVRSVVAMAPVGRVFDASSVASMTRTTLVLSAAQDEVLAPAFHGRRLRELMPQAVHEEHADAGHFAYMAQPLTALPSEAGDAAANPAGFDRPGFLKRLATRVLAHFDQTLGGQ